MRGTHADRQPVPVDVLADDDFAEESVRAWLRTRAEVTVREPDRQEAAVLLVLAAEVDETTWDRVRVRADRRGEPPRVVLVTDGMDEQHLWRAIASGLCAVVPRRSLTGDRLAAAVVSAAAGQVQLSPGHVRWLLDQVRSLQHTGAAAAARRDLTSREVDVLRLLAEGHGTGEIATMLSYSERTIKNVLQAVMGRHNLRSRSHAVAHALRVGAF